MKQQNLHVFCLLFFSFLLLSCFSASARLLLPKQGEKVNEMAHAPISGELKSEMELLGSSDECVKDKEDEECNKRMIEEAHLDYIYTQHHKRQP